jgi:hypothetical protein
VFGPEAKTRAWLVLDGQTLYVDRSCDGDLTGKDKAVPGVSNGNRISFSVGELTEPDSKTKHSHLRVRLSAQAVSLSLTVAGKRSHFVETSREGPLQFAGLPQEAPIIHLGGPLTFFLENPTVLDPRKKDQTLDVLLGTPGLGKGTFAHLLYDDKFIPNEACAVAEIEFSNKTPDGKPIHTHIAFKRRD